MFSTVTKECELCDLRRDCPHKPFFSVSRLTGNACECEEGSTVDRWGPHVLVWGLGRLGMTGDTYATIRWG